MPHFVEVLDSALISHRLDINSGWIDNVVSPEIRQYLSQRKEYDFVSYGSGDLLVTIGDSWTHGSWIDLDLDPGSTPAQRETFRQQHCFGHRLAQHLDQDWLNLALPATNNQWMAQVYAMLCDMASDVNYDNITVIMVLTEYGRELNCPTWRRQNGLHDVIGVEPLGPTRDTISQLQHCESIQELLRGLSEHVAQTITDHTHPKIQLLLATNYVSQDLYSVELSGYFLPRSWLETLAGGPLSSCHVVGGIAMPWLKAYSQRSGAMLNELLDIMDCSQQRLDLIYSTGLNRPEGYGHPNSAGHRIWADYLKTHIF